MDPMPDGPDERLTMTTKIKEDQLQWPFASCDAAEEAEGDER